MLSDLLTEAYTAMRHNRRRTALTMLGMAWGIATVCMLLAYGDGFGRACENIFASFGTKMMFIVPGRTSMQAGGDKAGAKVQLTLEDIDVISANIPQITHITPSNGKTSTVQYENRSFDFDLVGEYPITYYIRAITMEQGRWYNGQDEAQRARVAVIGPETKEKLFSGRNAVGEHIRIDGQSFEVIGVYAAKMQAGDGNNINRIVFVPYSTLGDVMDTHYLGSFLINYETNDYEQLEQAIRNVIADQHRYNPADRRALMVFNLMVQLHQFHIITIGLKILLAFIGTLTLGIGGVGLMNIMLVSVTQRTREIGVEKALGARSRHIFLQFLAEALAITMAGGVFGIILAYGVALSVGRLTLYSAMAKHAEEGDIRLMINPMTLLIAIAILAGVGLVSGMVPAIRASRLDPIEALRYE
ncbi:MAG TPA: ABC transporter permease [Terriglobales bacterium]|nr:ABC transporter permease [Terriglobales bacterium]